MDRIDPYIAAQVTEQVIVDPKSDITANFTQNFETFLTREACLSPQGVDWPKPTRSEITKDQCLGFKGWCSRLNCNMDVNDDPQCEGKLVF